MQIDQLGREISPLRDLVADGPARAADQEGAAADPAHAHREGRSRRPRRRASSPAPRRPPIIVHTFHGHVLRGYFGPRTLAFLPAARALARDEDDCADRREPAGAGRPRRARRRAEGAVRRDPARHRARRTGRRRTANGRADNRRYLGIPGDRFAVGWIGRMTAVKRTDDILVAFKRLRDGGVDAVLCLVGDGPDRARARASRARARRRYATPCSSATRRTSRRSTRHSTR